MATICPICDKGTLVDKQEHRTVQYKGFGLNVPIQFSRCTQCEACMANDEQTRKNKQACLALKASTNAHINQSMASTL